MHQRNTLVTGLGLIAPALIAIAACSDRITDPASATAARPAASVAESGIPTGKTVVVFKDTASISQAGLDLITSLGGTVTTRWDDIGVAFAVGLSVEALSTLSASDLVSSVGNDRIIDWLPGLQIGDTVDAGVLDVAQGDPSKSRFYMDGTQWSMRVTKADRAWAAGLHGTPSTRVAILDTGIDYDHRELRGLVDLGASKSFSYLIVSAAGSSAQVPVEPQAPGDEPYMDNHFHGTHVAATVTSNNVSVSGVAPRATLIAVKVLNFQGRGSFESVASGIRHAATAANADVINMSLGAQVEPAQAGVPALLELMKRTIKQAEKEGAIVISAAGNSATDLDAGTVVATPCEQSTMCISATGPLLQQNFDQPATYTNFGITAIEMAAPGGNATANSDGYVTKDLVIGACSRRASSGTLVVCRSNTDGVVYFYAYAAGTSMAAPHAAGAAALVKSYYPTLSPKGIAQRLMHSADDVHTAGRDVYTNWGRLNVAAALDLE